MHIMNPFVLLTDISENEIFPGFFGKFIHTETLTIGHIRIAEGAILPEHHHPQQQITNVLSGKLKMTINGKTKVCTPGISVVIPPNVPHSAVALTPCLALDVFHPVREDYKF